MGGDYILYQKFFGSPEIANSLVDAGERSLLSSHCVLKLSIHLLATDASFRNKDINNT
jgi:hypothetical protein